ncbi:hypothetical protein ACHAPE_002299 [Trichoderma viride]
MKFSLFSAAALPALALSQSTTTQTSTTVLTKTVTLARLHTVTAIASSHNATTTAASATYQSTGTAVSTSVGSTAFKPTVVPSTGAPVASTTSGPHSAGVALEASKIALVGVAGMMLFAMM